MRSTAHRVGTKATTRKLSVLRIAIYLRISQDRSGEGLGVARQEGDCRKLAEQIAAQRGTVAQIETFTDNDTSAYSGKRRKDYERLTAAVESGRFEIVTAWHPDRLHRAPIELETGAHHVADQFANRRHGAYGPVPVCGCLPCNTGRTPTTGRTCGCDQTSLMPRANAVILPGDEMMWSLEATRAPLLVG